MMSCLNYANAGITTVAITEDTPYTLWQNGVLNQHRDGDTTLLTFAPGFPGQRDRVMQMLQHKTGLSVTAEGTSDLRVSASWPQFNVTPIGLDNTAVQTVRRNGLRVSPRLQNYTASRQTASRGNSLRSRRNAPRITLAH